MGEVRVHMDPNLHESKPMQVPMQHVLEISTIGQRPLPLDATPTNLRRVVA